MQVVLREMDEASRRVIEPHIAAYHRAREAIRIYAQQLAPDLMAQPGVVFNVEICAWVRQEEATGG